MKASSARWSLRRWTLWTCRFPGVSVCGVTATYAPSIRAVRRTRTDRYCPRHHHGPPPRSGPFRAAQVRVRVRAREFASMHLSGSSLKGRQSISLCFSKKPSKLDVALTSVVYTSGNFRYFPSCKQRKY